MRREGLQVVNIRECFVPVQEDESAFVLEPVCKSNSFKTGKGQSGCGPCGGGKDEEEESTTGIKFNPFRYVNVLSPPDVDVKVIGKQKLC